MTEQQQTAVELFGKMVIFKDIPFGEAVDIDGLTRIDPHNVYAELLTISNLINKAGNLLADAEHHLRMTKIQEDISIANLTRTKSLELAAESSKKPTIKDIEAAVMVDPEYLKIVTRTSEIAKGVDYAKSLLVAAKDKSRKLEPLSMKLVPEEFNNELIEGKVNSVLVRMREKLIP